MIVDEVLQRLHSLISIKNIENMKRFNISFDSAFVVTAPNIRMIAKEITIDHQLALQLWSSGYHEARILASMIADAESANLRFWINGRMILRIGINAMHVVQIFSKNKILLNLFHFVGLKIGKNS
jgi:3-methyladenine DNA glycosylase AlkD